jgi:hypothetical protein
MPLLEWDDDDVNGMMKLVQSRFESWRQRSMIASLTDKLMSRIQEGSRDGTRSKAMTRILRRYADRRSINEMGGDFRTIHAVIDQVTQDR